MNVFLLALAVMAGATQYSLNVKDFGAVGDGVYDDTLALQKAADAVAGAGLANGRVAMMVRRPLTVMPDGPIRELFFPPGVYRVSGPVVFDNSTCLRGDRAEIRNVTATEDTFYFHHGFRLNVTGLSFTGGRIQLRHWTKNRDVASTRIADCTFAGAHDRAVVLDSYREIANPTNKPQLLPPYAISRLPDGRAKLTDTDLSNAFEYNNSTLIRVERCVFTNNACAMDAYSDGVNVDRCRFYAGPLSRGAMLKVRIMGHLTDLAFFGDGRPTDDLFAVEFGIGALAASGLKVTDPSGLRAFRIVAAPLVGGFKRKYQQSVRLHDVELDTGNRPVLMFGKDVVPEQLTLHRIRRTRAAVARQPLFDFEAVPTEAEAKELQKSIRQKDRPLRAAFGWSAGGIDERDFDLTMKGPLAACRVPASSGLVKRSRFDDAPLPATPVYTDEALGTASCRELKDDTDRLAALFVRAAETGGTVLLPPRWIRVSRTLELPRNVNVTAPGQAVVEALDPKLAIFHASGTPEAFLENIVFRDGANVLVTEAAAGRVRFLNCHFCDQADVAFKALTASPSEFRLEVGHGVSYVPHLYDGTASALFDAHWFSYTPDFDKALWRRVCPKGQSAIVNRAGGRLEAYDILGVPCVYWHVDKKDFFTWAGNIPAHPELYGDFRWIDNAGDLYALNFRFGGEWTGLTPVYQFGAAAKSVLVGHEVGGMSYGWRNAGATLVVSDAEHVDVTLEDLFCCCQGPEPHAVKWQVGPRAFRPAVGWVSRACYPFVP